MEPVTDLTNVSITNNSNASDEIDSGYLELISDYEMVKSQRSISNESDKQMTVALLESVTDSKMTESNEFSNDFDTVKLIFNEDKYTEETSIDFDNPHHSNKNPVTYSNPRDVSNSLIVEDIKNEIERNIPTDNLLENAQKLLKSVSQTLSSSKQISIKDKKLYIDVKLKDNVTTPKNMDIIKAYDQMSKSKLDNHSNGNVMTNGATANTVPGCGAVLPEGLACQWGAELLLAIEDLHNWGVFCPNLQRDSLLLGDHGQLWLSYQCSLSSYPLRNHSKDVLKPPELTPLFQYTQSCDWWSYGIILYELITGVSLQHFHPNGVTSHTMIYIPDWVTPEANSILTGLLKPNPLERLGCGTSGTNEIKSHRYYKAIDWNKLKLEFAC